MVNQYKVKVRFNELVQKWKKFNKIGFFLTRSPLKIGKKTPITLIYFNKKSQQRAKKLIENLCK